MGDGDCRQRGDVRYQLRLRQRARLALAARCSDNADLARLLDALALWPDLDADTAVGWAGMDLAGFNDSV